MDSIVVVANRKETKNFLKSECQKIINCQFTLKENPEELASFLNSDAEADVLVLESGVFPTRSALEKFVTEHRQSVRAILILDHKDLKEGSVSHHKSLPSLLVHLKRAISLSNVTKSGFAALSVDVLEYFQVLPFPLFQKKDKNSYTKSIPQMEQLCSEKILNLRTQGIEVLYYEKKHKRKLSRLLSTMNLSEEVSLL